MYYSYIARSATHSLPATTARVVHGIPGELLYCHSL